MVNSFLETEKLGKLMRQYSLPCIISLLVGALYNIVDQIFIANADYLGSYGNAANTVVFPLTVIALAIATTIGDGCCAYVSISLGAKENKRAAKSVGNAVAFTVLAGFVLMAVYLIFSNQILASFGATVNKNTWELSKEYLFWIALGIPFLYVRSGGKPHNPFRRKSEVCNDNSAGRGGNQLHFRPRFYICISLGNDGCGGCDGNRADYIGCACAFVSFRHKGGKSFKRQL